MSQLPYNNNSGSHTVSTCTNPVLVCACDTPKAGHIWIWLSFFSTRSHILELEWSFQKTRTCSTIRTVLCCTVRCFRSIPGIPLRARLHINHSNTRLSLVRIRRCMCNGLTHIQLKLAHLCGQPAWNINTIANCTIAGRTSVYNNHSIQGLAQWSRGVDRVASHPLH